MTEISDWSDLETQLQETKQQLAEVEQRLLQVRYDSIAKQDLLDQQAQIEEQIQELQIQDDLDDRPKNNSKIRRKPNSSNGRLPSDRQKEELVKQLQQLRDRLEQIEADLESRLLSWSSFREPFWQIVRFGGIGVIIGVILRSCVN